MASKRPTAPKVLWLMTDEQRTDSLGCYGSAWARTPALDALAARGTIFRHAITPSPVCVPARTSFLTGRYPHATGIWNNVPDRIDLPRLLEPFHAAGYRSASVGKQHHALRSEVFHEAQGIFERDQAVGLFAYREPYDGKDYELVQYPGPIPWILAGRYPEGPQTRCEFKVVDRCIDWLEAWDGAAPFFLRVSFPGPHTPVVPPEPFDTLIDDDAIALPAEADALPTPCPASIAEKHAALHTAAVLEPEQIRRMRRHYYGNVAFLDQQFGRLLDWMAQRGLLENTIIAFCSDHGTHLGDFGLVQKQSFFDPVVNVPCFITPPESMPAARGRTIQTPVSAMSLLPTLAELAGLTPPRGLDAPSLAEAVSNGAEPADQPVFSQITRGGRIAFFERHNVPQPAILNHQTHHAMVRDGRWKFMMTLEAGEEEHALFDLHADPLERRNLATDTTHRTHCERYAALIRQHVDERSPAP